MEAGGRPLEAGGRPMEAAAGCPGPESPHLSQRMPQLEVIRHLQVGRCILLIPFLFVLFWHFRTQILNLISSFNLDISFPIIFFYLMI